MQETNVFFSKVRTETDENTPPMQYAIIRRHQFSDLTRY